MSAPPQSDPHPSAGTELLVLARALQAEARRAERRGLRRLPAGAAATHAPPSELAVPSGPTAPLEPLQAAQGTPSKPASKAAPGPAPGPNPAAGTATGEPSSSTAAAAANCPDLESLSRVVADCRACGLCETRTQTVFADGTGKARVLFIGEAPGFNEDQEGVPFVGPAGALLTDIVEKGMGLKRSEVYIANVLKCRPPENRDPSAQEKERCTPFLDRQIELVDPEVLIPLGRHAANHVLGTDQAMSRLRGKVHELRGRRVVPTYHPAYLLRTPSAKRDCWQDIQLAMGVLGLERPGR